MQFTSWGRRPVPPQTTDASTGAFLHVRHKILRSCSPVGIPSWVSGGLRMAVLECISDDNPPFSPSVLEVDRHNISGVLNMLREQALVFSGFQRVSVLHLPGLVVPYWLDLMLLVLKTRPPLRLTPNWTLV